jgi:hypothetical protein
MALEAAAGQLAQIETLLANNLANATTFQEMTGAANAAAALGSIYFGSIPEPANGAQYTEAELAAIWPCAVIATDAMNGFTWRRDASGPHYLPSGTLEMVLERETPSGTWQEIDRAWKNKIGQLVKRTDEGGAHYGILDWTDADGDYLRISQCVLLAIGTSEIDEVEGTGSFQQAVLRIDWGAQ